MPKPKFFCSICGRTLRSGGNNSFTSCGHFICQDCATFRPGDEISCPVCRADAGTLRIEDDPMRMPSSVRHFFQDPAALLMQGIEVLKFQRAHQNNRDQFIKQQLGAASKIQEENEGLKHQLQESKANLADMQREVGSLRSKLSEVVQQQRYQRSRSQERVQSAPLRQERRLTTPGPFSMQKKLLPAGASMVIPGTPRLNTPILHQKENRPPQFIMPNLTSTSLATPAPLRPGSARFGMTPDRGSRRFDLLNSGQ